MSVRHRLLAVSATAAAATAAALGGPAMGVTSAAGPTAPHTTISTVPTASGYVPGSRDDAQNARLRANLAQAQQSAAARSTARQAASVVYYDSSNAPSYAAVIDQSASIWNSAVSNVQLVEGGPASLDYYEGNDPRGSYASSDGHGSGYVFIDYAQTQQYDQQRVVTHETGHVLGLPDTYDGPCSQLMSGGGPGPSCTNSQPDGTEQANVEALWANGFAAASSK